MARVVVSITNLVQPATPLLYQTSEGGAVRQPITKSFTPSLSTSRTREAVCCFELPGTGKSPLYVERLVQLAASLFSFKGLFSAGEQEKRDSSRKRKIKFILEFSRELKTGHLVRQPEYSPFLRGIPKGRGFFSLFPWRLSGPLRPGSSPDRSGAEGPQP